MTLHLFTFYATIVFVIIGAILALVGLWFEDFWNNSVSWKLFLTDVIFAVTSVIVATITKLLT